MHNKLQYPIIGFVLIYYFVKEILALDFTLQDECEGCQKCILDQNSKPKCSICLPNFQIDRETGLCLQQKCLPGNFHDKIKDQCVSICPEMHISDDTSRRCIEIKECPYFYSNQILDERNYNLEIISIDVVNLFQQQGLVNQKAIFLIYNNQYAKIIDIENGEIMQKYNLDEMSIISIFVKKQFIFFFTKQNQVGMVDSYNFNKLKMLSQLLEDKGHLSNNSHLEFIYESKILVSSYDVAKQITYIHILDIANKNITQTLDIEVKIDEINIFDKYILIIKSNSQKFSLMSIEEKEEKYIKKILVENLGEFQYDLTQYIISTQILTTFKINNILQKSELNWIDLSQQKIKKNLLTMNDIIRKTTIKDEILYIYGFQKTYLYNFKMELINELDISQTSQFVDFLFIKEDSEYSSLIAIKQEKQIYKYKLQNKLLQQQQSIPLVLSSYINKNSNQLYYSGIINKMYYYYRDLQEIDIKSFKTVKLTQKIDFTGLSYYDRITKIIFHSQFNYLVYCKKYSGEVVINELAQKHLPKKLISFLPPENSNQCNDIQQFQQFIVVYWDNSVSKIILNDFSVIELFRLEYDEKRIIVMQQVQNSFFIRIDKIQYIYNINLDQQPTNYNLNFQNQSLFYINEQDYFYIDSGRIYRCSWKNTEKYDLKPNSDIQSITFIQKKDQSYQILVSLADSKLQFLDYKLQQIHEANIKDFTIPFEWPNKSNQYCSTLQVLSEDIFLCHSYNQNIIEPILNKVKMIINTSIQIYVLISNQKEILASQSLIDKEFQQLLIFSGITVDKERTYISRSMFGDKSYFGYQTHFKNSNLPFINTTKFIDFNKIYFAGTDQGILISADGNHIIEQNFVNKNSGDSENPIIIDENENYDNLIGIQYLIFSKKMDKIFILNQNIIILNMHSLKIEKIIKNDKQQGFFLKYQLEDEQNQKLLMTYSSQYLSIVAVTNGLVSQTNMLQIPNIKSMYFSLSLQKIYLFIGDTLYYLQFPIKDDHDQPTKINTQKYQNCELTSQIFICFTLNQIFIYNQEQMKENLKNPQIIQYTSQFNNFFIDFDNQNIFLLFEYAYDNDKKMIQINFNGEYISSISIQSSDVFQIYYFGQHIILQQSGKLIILVYCLKFKYQTQINILNFQQKCYIINNKFFIIFYQKINSKIFQQHLFQQSEIYIFYSIIFLFNNEIQICKSNKISNQYNYLNKIGLISILKRDIIKLMKQISLNDQDIICIKYLQDREEIAITYKNFQAGLIFFYSLLTYEKIAISNHSHANGINYVTDILYDIYNQKLFSISLNGQLVEWDLQTKGYKSLYQITALYYPKNYDQIVFQLNEQLNKLYIYSKKINLIQVNYNNLIQGFNEIIVQNNSLHQCFQDQSNKQICYFIDMNLILYKLENQQTKYITKLNEQITFFNCIGTCEIAFLFQKNKVLIFTNYFIDMKEQNEISFFKFIAENRIQDIAGQYYIFNKIKNEFAKDLIFNNQFEKVLVISQFEKNLFIGSQNGKVDVISPTGSNGEYIRTSYSIDYNTQGQIVLILVKSNKSFVILQNNGALTYLTFSDNKINLQIKDVKNVFTNLYQYDQFEITQVINFAVWDDLYNRLYINQQGKQAVFILEKEFHQIVTVVSLPSHYSSFMQFSKKYVYLYSQNQVNIHLRTDLSLFDIIRKQYNNYQITQVIPVYSQKDDVIIILYKASTEIYVLDSIKKVVILIQQQSNNINYPLVFDSYIQSNQLFLILVSNNQIFQSNIDLQNIHQKQCQIPILFQNNYQADKAINKYTQFNNNLNQTFFVKLKDQSNIFYSQNQSNVIFFPQDYTKNNIQISELTFSNKLFHEMTEFYHTFAISDFNLQFINKGFFLFPLNVKSILMNNIKIINNKSLYKNYIKIDNVDMVSISNFFMENIETNENELNSFWYFSNIKSVSIQTLSIIKSKLKSIGSIFSFSKIENLYIDNLILIDTQINTLLQIKQVTNIFITKVQVINCYFNSLSRQRNLKQISKDILFYEQQNYFQDQQWIQSQFIQQHKQQHLQKQQNQQQKYQQQQQQEKNLEYQYQIDQMKNIQNNLTYQNNNNLIQQSSNLTQLNQQAFQTKQLSQQDTYLLQKNKIQNQQNNYFFFKSQNTQQIKDNQQVNEGNKQKIKQQAFSIKRQRYLDSSIQNNSQINNIQIPPKQFKSIIELEGCLKINIKNVKFENNVDIALVTNQNVIKDDQVTIDVKNTIIRIEQLTMTNNKFKTNKINDYYNYLMYISAQKVILQNISSYLNQAHIQLHNVQDFTMITGIFVRNSCISGCGLYLYNIINVITILSSRFENNIASANGGAILINSFNQLNIDKSTNIVENKALIGGGIRLLNDQISNRNLTELFNVVQNNQASIFGNNIATYLQNMEALKIKSNYEYDEAEVKIQKNLNPKQTDDLNTQNIVITNLQSGGVINLGINLIDQEGYNMTINNQNILDQSYPIEIINEISQYSLEIVPIQSEISELSGQQYVNYNSYNNITSSFVFSKVKISKQINGKTELLLKYKFNLEQDYKTIKLLVYFRDCRRGEVKKNLSSQINICYTCPFGTYSLLQFPIEKQTNINQENGLDIDNNQQQQCITCPKGAISCELQYLNVKNGYWKKNNNTDVIIECQKRPFACQSESNKSINGCIEGYIGPLCESCDIDGAIWKRIQQSNSSNNSQISRYITYPLTQNCSQCDSLSYHLSYFLIEFIGISILMYLLILQMMKTLTHQSKANYIRILKILPISHSGLRDQLIFHIKIIINYLQIRVLVINFSNSINAGISTSIQLAGQTSTLLTYHLNCIYPSDWSIDPGFAALQGIWNSIIPIFFVIILLIIIQFISFIVWKPQSKNKKKSLYFSSITNPHNILTMLQFIFYFFQPNAIHFLMSSISCRNISGDLYVNFYPATLCEDEYYQYVFQSFFIPTLIIWAILPFIFLVFLIMRRKKLWMSSSLQRYGFLYLEFKNQYYLWEFVRVYMKILIVSLHGYYLNSQNQAISKIYIVIILIIYISLKFVFKPFSNKTLSNFDTLSYFVLALLIFLQYINEQYSQTDSLNFAIFIINHIYIFFMILVALLSKTFFSIYKVSDKFHNKFLIRVLPKKLYRLIFKQRLGISMEVCFRWTLIQKNINYIIATNVLQNFENIQNLEQIDKYNLKAQQFLQNQMKIIKENEQKTDNQKDNNILKKEVDDNLDLNINMQKSLYPDNSEMNDNTFDAQKMILQNIKEFDLGQQENIEQSGISSRIEQHNIPKNMNDHHVAPSVQNISMNNSYINNESIAPIDQKRQIYTMSSSQILNQQDYFSNTDQRSQQRLQKQNEQNSDKNSSNIQHIRKGTLQNFSSHSNIISVKEIEVAVDENNSKNIIKTGSYFNNSQNRMIHTNSSKENSSKNILVRNIKILQTDKSEGDVSIE